MAVSVPSNPQILQVKNVAINLAQNAGTYTDATATGGDIWCEVVAAFVSTAAGGLTSASISTNTATVPVSIVGSTILASLTASVALTLVGTSFVLPSTKAIQHTIVGTGNAGLITLVVKWAPLTAGATLV